MSKLNMAIIGVGNIGQHHARIYNELPQANLVAVCDTELENAGEIARKYECSFYDDYNKMLAEQEIDAVSIAAPTFLHHEIACDILNAGKHVLLEKPIATNLSDAKDIIDTARSNNLKLMIGHIERFNPAIQRLKELIVHDRIGQIISINIKRVGGIPPQVKDANVMIDLGIHDIDISNYLLEKNPKEVYGYKSRNLVSKQEDSAVILLKYDNSSSFIEVNWVTPVKIRTLDVTGSKAFARLDYIQQTITLYENSYLNLDPNLYSNFDEFIAKYSLTDEISVGVVKEEPLKCEIEDFIASIIDDRTPAVSGEDGYKALEIALSV